MGREGDDGDVCNHLDYNYLSGRLLFLWSCGIRMKGWSEIPHVTGVNIT